MCGSKGAQMPQEAGLRAKEAGAWLSDEMKASTSASAPLGRIATPDDIAFLARISQCAPTARVASGGRFDPGCARR